MSIFKDVWLGCASVHPDAPVVAVPKPVLELGVMCIGCPVYWKESSIRSPSHLTVIAAEERQDEPGWRQSTVRDHRMVNIPERWVGSTHADIVDYGETIHFFTSETSLQKPGATTSDIYSDAHGRRYLEETYQQWSEVFGEESGEEIPDVIHHPEAHVSEISVLVVPTAEVMPVHEYHIHVTTSMRRSDSGSRDHD